MADGVRAWVGQFEGLALDRVGTWPLLPRVVAWVGTAALILVGGYFAVWAGQLETLDGLDREEQAQREQYRTKLQQAINLEALQRQKEQVSQYVLTLEKQLPSRSEMEELLSELSRAWTGRGVEFESLKPGPRVLRDYYEEQPIALRVSGKYHSLGAFTSDLANLPRIVTLQNLSLLAGKDGGITMDATVRSFRYLTEEEVRAQKQAAQAKKK